jgi:hypothetical protein
VTIVRHPRVLVCSLDDWLANQLRPLAAEHRWLLGEFRQLAAALAPACESRPTVVLVQLDLDSVNPEAFDWMVQVRIAQPDAALIAVLDTKVSDLDRQTWTANLMALGARLVLFPPLTRPVLEDAVLGLMTAIRERTARPDATRLPGAGAIVDLAVEGMSLE